MRASSPALDLHTLIDAIDAAPSAPAPTHLAAEAEARLAGICAHVVLDESPDPDAELEVLVAASRIGAPILDAAGRRIGMLWATSEVSRDWRDDERATLTGIASPRRGGFHVAA